MDQAIWASGNSGRSVSWSTAGCPGSVSRGPAVFENWKFLAGNYFLGNFWADGTINTCRCARIFLDLRRRSGDSTISPVPAVPSAILGPGYDANVLMCSGSRWACSDATTITMVNNCRFIAIKLQRRAEICTYVAIGLPRRDCSRQVRR